MFPAEVLMPSWDPAVRDDVAPDVIARYIDADDHALASRYTWVVRTPQKVEQNGGFAPVAALWARCGAEGSRTPGLLDATEAL